MSNGGGTRPRLFNIYAFGVVLLTITFGTYLFSTYSTGGSEVLPSWLKASSHTSSSTTSITQSHTPQYWNGLEMFSYEKHFLYPGPIPSDHDAEIFKNTPPQPPVSQRPSSQLETTGMFGADWNKLVLEELKECLAAGTCEKNQGTIVVFVESWAERGIFEGWRGGEGVW